MKTTATTRLVLTGVMGLAFAGIGATLAACDRESSTSKEKTTKVVDTPEGKKKVTETTETTTTKDKKDNP